MAKKKSSGDDKAIANLQTVPGGGKSTAQKKNHKQQHHIQQKSHYQYYIAYIPDFHFKQTPATKIYILKFS